MFGSVSLWVTVEKLCCPEYVLWEYIHTCTFEISIHIYRRECFPSKVIILNFKWVPSRSLATPPWWRDSGIDASLGSQPLIQTSEDTSDSASGTAAASSPQNAHLLGPSQARQGLDKRDVPNEPGIQFLKRSSRISLLIISHSFLKDPHCWDVLPRQSELRREGCLDNL